MEPASEVPSSSLSDTTLAVRCILTSPCCLNLFIRGVYVGVLNRNLLSIEDRCSSSRIYANVVS